MAESQSAITRVSRRGCKENDARQVDDATGALQARWLVRFAIDPTATESDARSLALQAARL
jgi:hypothetical protein